MYASLHSMIHSHTFTKCPFIFQQISLFGITQYQTNVKGEPFSRNYTTTPQLLSSSSVVKNLPANAGGAGSIPGPGKIPWRRKWQPTSVFLPGKSYGQKSLLGYHPSSPKRVGCDLTAKEQLQQQFLALMMKIIKQNFLSLATIWWGRGQVINKSDDINSDKCSTQSLRILK